MRWLRSRREIIDNTGVQQVRVFKVVARHARPSTVGGVGDRFLASVRKRKAGSRYQLGDVVRVLRVQSVAGTSTASGVRRRFARNAGVVVTPAAALVGTRVRGVVSSQLRRGGHTKVLSLASKVV